MKAPRPSNEKERLEALERYRVLDTAAEDAYDDVATLASYVCSAPVAYISLVAENRQWFKSKIGMSGTETSREVAFCAHTILGKELLEISDALMDERFAGSPLARAPHDVRFYAGMPLVTPDGFSVGALCVVDHQPRTLQPEQRKALRALARQVVQLLELRRVSSDLAATLSNLRVLRGLLPICAYCRKIRDDAGYWSELESYVEAHAGVDFSHGICPACVQRHFGEVLKGPVPKGAPISGAAEKR
jgi:GAF domain-containing protein